MGEVISLKKNKGWVIFLFILVIGVSALLWMQGFGPSGLESLPKEKKSPENPPAPLTQQIPSPSEPRLPPPTRQPVSLLLIGVDQRKGDVGRADALMIVTLNPSRKTVKVLNIPRDSKTRLVLGEGRLQEDKINHAYSLGNGIPSTVRTVEQFLSLPIHHYVKVNFSGFRRVVDLFGGVDVEGSRNFSYKGHTFKKGPMKLNGSQALAYVRDRTGGNDLDRHKRQQQVMRSLWKKGTHWSTLLKMDDLYHILQQHVTTDLSLQDTWRLLRTLRLIQEENVEVLHLSGRDQWSPRYYMIVPEKERQRVSQVLREHLELKSPTSHRP